MKYVNVVLISLILLWINVLIGCTAKQEIVVRTQIIYPDFSECIRPSNKPVNLIKYRRNEDLDSTYNFNAFMKNHSIYTIHIEQLNNVIDCWETQIEAVRQKQMEVTNVNSSQ